MAFRRGLFHSVHNSADSSVVLSSAGENISQGETLGRCCFCWRPCSKISGSGTCLRIYSTSRAGSTPTQNRLRQAQSSGSTEKAMVYSKAATPQPTAQPLFAGQQAEGAEAAGLVHRRHGGQRSRPAVEVEQRARPAASAPSRSEEHTSELQSLMRTSYA